MRSQILKENLPNVKKLAPVARKWRGEYQGRFNVRSGEVRTPTQIRKNVIESVTL